MNSIFDHQDTPLPLDFFQRKYRLSRSTLWRYRKVGLKTILVGTKCFIRESEFVAFLQSMDGRTTTANAQQSEGNE